MVNKKGDGHVDWIISIGIFLIFLLSIFVIFKPGIQPSQDYNTLLDILETNVKEDFNWTGDHFGGFYWTIYKFPLFIKEGTGTGTPKMNSGCVKIDFPYEITKDAITVYKPEIIEGEEVLTPIPKYVDGKEISINVDGLGQNYKKYMIYFSENNIYSYRPDNLKGELNTVGLDCYTSDGSNFEYNVGIGEKTRGIAEDTLGILNLNIQGKKEYYEDKLKPYYGYPKSKEFAIMVIKSNGETLEYKPIIPDVKTNVYTKEWGEFILNYDGSRSPIKINLKVW